MSEFPVSLGRLTGHRDKARLPMRSRRHDESNTRTLHLSNVLTLLRSAVTYFETRLFSLCRETLSRNTLFQNGKNTN